MPQLLRRRTLRPAIGLLVFLLLSTQAVWATHNRAGEIRVEQLGEGLTVRATVFTYTAFQGNSADADRDSVLVEWGDGSAEWVLRSNGNIGPSGFPNGEPLPGSNNLKLNVYVAEHTYSGRGRYVIGMQDPNRIDGIRNINNGGSVDVRFYIRTVYTFLDPNFQGPNSTPILLQAPIDEGCTDRLFLHNPNAFDPDGDSLAYRLGVPLEGEGVPVSNYQSPSEFGSQAGPSRFTIDETTGTLSWNTPRQSGDYNAVILILSFRNGTVIDTTVRDMQISIRECDNLPPVVEVATDFCLVTGDSLRLEPVATAPVEEPDQQIRLEVTSPTLELDISPATWDGDTLYHDQPWQRTFRWQTVCEHTARFPYNIIFKATDDFRNTSGRGANLSTLQVATALVSAPGPEDLAAEVGVGFVDLSWASPYACEDAEDEFFFGFSVWRREGSNPFPFDSCRQGLAGRGYTRIANRVTELVDDRYFFADTDLEQGRTYCYRVLAQFVRYTASGRPFNLVESLPSAEVCIQSSRDLPLLTRVDVLSTDDASGQIDVRWTPPLAADLDTLDNPPPYRYTLLRSPGIGTANFTTVPGAGGTFSSFAELQLDTQFVDTDLDTRSQGYTYALDFSADAVSLGPPLPSSSVFLQAGVADGTVNLSWLAETSWENVNYAVLREGTAGFDTIARTPLTTFSDTGLDNGREYCYQIVAFGTYGVSTIMTSIVNRSQELCAVPEDREGPCAPVPNVATVCDDLGDRVADPPFTNSVTFAFPNACEPAPDLALFRVYQVADSSGADRALVAEIDARRDSVARITDLFNVAACYVAVAVDSSGNEGPPSELVCVDNCPFYLLPNAITPNGDGRNDFLVPRSSRFVERVEFTLFNRWGVLVYETEDPELGWDGTTLNGEPVSDGTYYYACRVFERRPDGELQLVGEEPLQGFVEVFREP